MHVGTSVNWRTHLRGRGFACYKITWRQPVSPLNKVNRVYILINTSINPDECSVIIKIARSDY